MKKNSNILKMEDWTEIEGILKERIEDSNLRDNTCIIALTNYLLNSSDKTEKYKTLLELIDVLSKHNSSIAIDLIFHILRSNSNSVFIEYLLKLIKFNNDKTPEFMQIIRKLMAENVWDSIPAELIYNIAVFIEETVKNEQDTYDIALELYSRAKKMGYKDSELRFTCLGASKIKKPYKDKELMDALKKFHKKNKHIASYTLGNIYLNKAKDFKPKKDKNKHEKKHHKAIKKAVAFFECAAENKHYQSIIILKKLYEKYDWLPSSKVQLARYKAEIKVYKKAKCKSDPCLKQLGNFEKLRKSFDM